MSINALNTWIIAGDNTVARSSADGRSLGERISDNKIMHHEYIVANSLYVRIFTAYISIPLLQAVKNKSCK